MYHSFDSNTVLRFKRQTFLECIPVLLFREVGTVIHTMCIIFYIYSNSFVNFFEMLIWLYKIYRGRHNKQEGRGRGSDSGGSPPTDYAGPGGSRRSDQPGIYQG